MNDLKPHWSGIIFLTLLTAAVVLILKVAP